MSAEAAALQERATVWTSSEGVPLRLVWGHRRFVVSARPIPWIDRSPWWESLSRMPAGGADLLEQQMWQVQATAEDGQILIFDLVACAQAQWPVTGIYD